ncbi:MAG TPA: hypothetical protein VFR14_11215 [Candidatus Limnocylindrales bacterium]|nr:hypothetical protein [Candidatus Limnocylindrales bacterium]
MASAILQMGCTIQCPHGGQATAVPSNTRVKVDGAFALLPTDTFTIAGCSFTLPPGTPSPCLTIQWLGEATKVKINGTGPLLESSTGLCKAATQAPQGPASISGTQTKVKAT